HLPERAAVQAAHRAGEPAGGPAHPGRVAPAAWAAQTEFIPPVGRRRACARRPMAGCHGPAPRCQRRCWQSGLRAPAPAGNRPLHDPQAAPADAGRAGRGPEPPGKARPAATDRPVAPRVRRGGAADRARHEPDHGDIRPDPGDGARQAHHHRHARAGAQRRARHQGVPGGRMMLKLDNIHTYYGAIQALDGVSVEVNQGEIVTLIGANGAGKTTLLMTVCGNPRAREGTITFEGEDITHKDTHHIMRSGIAISPEGRRVFKDLTVAENLMMGGFFASREVIQAGLEHVYGLFPRLKERANQRAGTMSGGEQQMLAIGRALMTRPKLLL